MNQISQKIRLLVTVLFNANETYRRFEVKLTCCNIGVGEHLHSGLLKEIDIIGLSGR